MTPEHARLVRCINQALIEHGAVMTLDDLISLARERKAQIWSEGNAIAVTQILAFPQRKVLDIVVGAGELDALMAMQPRVEAFARAEGCSLMSTHGRSAWRRIGRSTGWFPHSILFTKSLPQ